MSKENKEKTERKKTEWKPDEKITMTIRKGEEWKPDKKLIMKIQEGLRHKKKDTEQ